MTPQKIRRGARYEGLPTDQINAGIDALGRLARGPITRVPDVGSSTTRGASFQLVRVYDDVERATLVRCLPVTVDDETAGDTSAEFVSVKPWDVLAAFDLDATGCCGEDGGPAPPGVSVNVPTVTNDAIAITGAGAAEFATITVSVSDGATTLSPAVTNAGDGSWSTAGVSLSSLNDGLVTITATDGSTSMTVAVWWEETRTGTPPQTPDRPQMTAATDTGSSSTDNRTANTTPAFSVATKDVPDATGPVPVLLIDGAIVAVQEARDTGSFSGSLTIDLTLAANLSEGTHTAQVYLYDDDTPGGSLDDTNTADRHSDVSDALVFIVDTSATETGDAPRVNRAGVIASMDIAGTTESRLVLLAGCSRQNTTAENDKLDA